MSALSAASIALSPQVPGPDAANTRALLVGADRLGNIPQVLSRFGIAIKHHVSGRDAAHQKRSTALPRGTDVVILFTDFIGHNVMKSYRDAAQREGVKVLACRRSVCSVQQTLETCGYRPCADCPAYNAGT